MIPNKVDLREFLWPVENIGDVLGAAACAATTALEYHCNRMSVEPTNLSSMFVHYNARLLNGDENTQKGTGMQAAMNAIAKYGACRESTWPFDPAALTVRPSPEAYSEAKKFAVVKGFHPSDVFETLAGRYPIPFMARFSMRGLALAGRNGTLPPLTEEERAQPNTLIGHAMLLVGYDKTAKTFTARNCWGDKWGDAGHCSIPFDVFNALVPRNVGYLWMIMAADANVTTNAEDSAPRTGASRAPSAASQPDTLASRTGTMQQDIRSDLERDLAESSQRIKDMLRRNQ